MMFIERFQHCLNQGGENLLWFAIQTVVERCPNSKISVHWDLRDICERFQASLTEYEEECVHKVMSEWTQRQGDFQTQFQLLHDILLRFRENRFKVGDILRADVFHLDIEKQLRYFARVEAVNNASVIVSSGEEVFTISPLTGFRPVPKTLGFWYQIHLPGNAVPKRDPDLEEAFVGRI